MMSAAGAMPAEACITVCCMGKQAGCSTPAPGLRHLTLMPPMENPYEEEHAVQMDGLTMLSSLQHLRRYDAAVGLGQTSRQTCLLTPFWSFCINRCPLLGMAACMLHHDSGCRHAYCLAEFICKHGLHALTIHDCADYGWPSAMWVVPTC